MLRGLLLSAPSLLHRQQHHQHQLLRQSLRRNAGILIYTASKNPHFYKIQNTKLQKTHIPIQSFDSPPRVRHSESEILHKWKRGWMVDTSFQVRYPPTAKNSNNPTSPTSSPSSASATIPQPQCRHPH